MIKIINTGTANKIKNNHLEDLQVLNSIEAIFLKKRKTIVDVPKPNSNVVACLSGGMDTVASIAILMEEFGLNVFPFFINRKQANYEWEKKSIKFFDNYFKKRYSNLYNKCKEIKVETPASAYKKELRRVKKANDNIDFKKNVAYPARNSIIALTGMEYAYSLQNKKIFPKTIFLANTADDPVFHSTLTAIRTVNLLICQIMSDYNWQVIALPIEKEFNNYYGKEIMLKWCDEHNIPIEKTRSCYKNDPVHCGKCFPACLNRKKAFKKAGIIDKTVYKK